jgi:transcriptional regulator with XRE-family HTH domain
MASTENHNEIKILPGNYRDWLMREYAERRARNAAYSLRSFSKLLKLDPSTVSQLLSGKRNGSQKLIAKLCDRLNAPPQLRLMLLKAEHAENENASTGETQFQQITLDSFAVISDWYHYAILELTYCKDFKSDPAWIARRLGITAIDVKAAIERLKRLNLLLEEDGVLKDSNGHLTNISQGLSVPALKNLQRQVLTMALESLDNTPVEERDITSMTMAIDPVLLPVAREKIKKFRRSLCKFLETNGRTRVYQLGIQFYPVSKFEN